MDTKKKIKIIALCGEAGSGKDRLLKELLKQTNWHGIVSCTTRPPREKEVNGKDYFFLTNEEFGKKILNGDMLEAVEFNDWFYGTSFSSLDENNINIGVFNPEGIEILLEDKRLDLKIYYLKVTPKERLIRQLNREINPDIDEIIRRYKADKMDFDNLNFRYTSLKNEYIQHIQLNTNRIIEDIKA